MGNKNGKKLILGALSAVAASVAAGALVKKTIIDKKSDEKSHKKPKEKKTKSIYYTVSLNDIYDSYNDKTLSEDDMINEIKRETTL